MLFHLYRSFPVDMASFSIHLCEFFKHPKAKIGVNTKGKDSLAGWLENDILKRVTTPSAIECRGSENEVCR